MTSCTRCGAAFTCGMAAGDSNPCWCTALPNLLPVPGAGSAADAPGCWCPACLREEIARRNIALDSAPARLYVNNPITPRDKP